SARTDIRLTESDGDLYAFTLQAEKAIPTPAVQAMQDVWDPADRAIRKVLRHDATAELALREAKHRFDDVRRPLPSPASPTGALLALGALGLFAAFRWVKRSREPLAGDELKRSMPAYRYVLHAALAVGLLVILPLSVGAATSLFAGHDEGRRYVGLA